MTVDMRVLADAILAEWRHDHVWPPIDPADDAQADNVAPVAVTDGRGAG